jgi:RHS repeat-associated protein
MAMKKRFYTMNSQMMAYDEGGVTKDFLTDHLGSITAEIDQTQTRTYDTRYSAYGRNLWSTGTGCGFGWVGSYGYRETGLLHMSHYVRARHYSYVTGGWSTVDPLWPDESAYGYVRGGPVSLLDLDGRQGRGILDQIQPETRPRNCHTGEIVTGKLDWRRCYGGNFSNCMCDAALEGDAAGNRLRREKPPQGMLGLPGGHDNAIAHCLTACIIVVRCGASGAAEWQSREDNLLCYVWPRKGRDCKKDEHNNGIGIGIGKGVKDPNQAARCCKEGCLKAYRDGRLDLV